MKKIVSLFMALVLMLSIAMPTSATESTTEVVDTPFSFYNADGEIVTVIVSHADTAATAKVYVDGTLTQQAVADSSTKTITTNVYDLSTTTRNSPNTETGSMGEFTTYTVHMPVSTESIAVVAPETQSRYLVNEPVDNSGLSASGYGDGYYSLGTYGGFYYAPDVYGYLYRSYTRTYDGETHTWTWGPSDTLAAITAYLSSLGHPVALIISMLLFGAGEYLAYTQSIKLATYTYNYNYRVRVYGAIHYTAYRNITYWRIDNVTEGTTRWEQKRFNHGFSMANSEMVKLGIDNYLLSIQ